MQEFMQEMEMSVSPIVRKGNQKYIYVMFREGNRFAEGRLPEGKILSNQGFSEEETAALELYLKSDQGRIAEMAKYVNAMDAFLKKK